MGFDMAGLRLVENPLFGVFLRAREVTRDEACEIS
jgi:hypothetical protein